VFIVGPCQLKYSIPFCNLAALNYCVEGFRSLLEVGFFDLEEKPPPDEFLGLKQLNRIAQNYIALLLHYGSASEWHFTPPK